MIRVSLERRSGVWLAPRGARAASPSSTSSEEKLNWECKCITFLIDEIIDIYRCTLNLK